MLALQDRSGFRGPDPATGPTARRLAVAAGLAVVALQIAAFHDLRHDDAYITYRYGQNLASGRGLVFDPGERVMASTSPGQALLSAALYPLAGRDGLPSWMSALGCVAWTAQAFAVWMLLRGALCAAWAGVVAAAIAFGAAGSAAWVALETNAPVALALWAMVAALRSRWTLAAALVALAGLLRPDAWLVGALLGFGCVRELRRRAWRPAAVGLLLTLPWVAFAWIYFGSVLPRSALVKVGRSDAADYLVHLLRHPAQVATLGSDAPALHALAWALAIAGAVWLVRRAPRLWILPGYGIAHLAAYAVLRPVREHVWHLYPLALVFVVLAWVGVAALAHAGVRRRPALRMPAAAAAAVLVALVLARTASFASEHRTAPWHGARDAAYRELARYLVDHARPGDRVAAAEVGTIAYYSDLPVRDLGGLATAPADGPPDFRWVVVAGPAPAPPGDRPAVAVFERAGFEARLVDLERTERAGRR